MSDRFNLYAETSYLKYNRNSLHVGAVVAEERFNQHLAKLAKQKKIRDAYLKSKMCKEDPLC